MKAPVLLSLAAVLLLGAGALLGVRQAARLAEEPDPSFAEDALSNHRHPDVDTNVDLYINHWRNSLPTEGHGGLIERDILTPGDPLHPPRKGAVLKYITGYKRASLEPRCETQPFREAAGQAFFFVTSGKGSIEAEGRKAGLEEGTAVFVPAGIAYRFSNPMLDALEMILVTESIPSGFVPARAISVGSYRGAEPSVGMHWAHIGRGILWDAPPKFANPMGFAVVSIDRFDIAQPHVHGPGCEEIWCQLRGESLLLFGNRLLRQEPGEAFLVPPNKKVPHASINPGDEPMFWLYMGNRHDQVR